jgi:hypothetical protein
VQDVVAMVMGGEGDGWEEKSQIVLFFFNEKDSAVHAPTLRPPPVLIKPSHRVITKNVGR